MKTKSSKKLCIKKVLKKVTILFILQVFFLFFPVLFEFEPNYYNIYNTRTRTRTLSVCVCETTYTI